jgi:hypothetical protein
MKTFIRLAFIALLSPLALLGNIMWQTTRSGTSSGECQLESNTITMTIHPLVIDVVEEAVLSARGNVWWGDPQTLEIVAEFSLSKGSAFRSLLLWNGDKVLKAKLRERNAADSAYQQVVNREVPRDPVIAEYLGDSRYRCRIFPVVLNGSRKIRVLYSVPLQMSNEGPQFQVFPAFTVGAAYTPTQIPVEFRRSGQTTGTYIVSYGAIMKTVQFGAVYEIQYDCFRQIPTYDYWGNVIAQTPQYLIIAPDSLSASLSYEASIDSGKAAGHYAAVFTAPPDSVAAAIAELSASDRPSVEAKVIAGGKAYIADLNEKSFVGIYLKSTSTWDRTVHWNVYSSRGRIALHFEQDFSPVSDSVVNRLLPQIWGAKYSLVEGLGSTGALFGFVDQQMSLLALETDVLSASDAAKWSAEGVPPLKPEEILVRASQIPSTPAENIMYEYGSGVISAMENSIASFSIAVLANRTASLRFGAMQSGSVKAVLLDLSGRVLATWNDLPVRQHAARISLPARAKGCMILRVYAGKTMMQKRFSVL